MHGRESYYPGASAVISAANLSWRELPLSPGSSRASLLCCVRCVVLRLLHIDIVIITCTKGAYIPLMYSKLCRVTSVHERPPSLL